MRADARRCSTQIPCSLLWRIGKSVNMLWLTETRFPKATEGCAVPALQGLTGEGKAEEASIWTNHTCWPRAFIPSTTPGLNPRGRRCGLFGFPCVVISSRARHARQPPRKASANDVNTPSLGAYFLVRVRRCGRECRILQSHPPLLRGRKRTWYVRFWPSELRLVGSQALLLEF